MKKLEKAWIFIWAGAMLLFGLLTVNGLRFQYGDTVRTIVRGVDDLNLGSDLTGGLELALQPESGLPAEQQLLDNAREVLMKRLDYLGHPECGSHSGFGGEPPAGALPQSARRFPVRLP